MTQNQDTCNAENMSDHPQVLHKDEELERLMAVDSNVKQQVEAERKQFQKKIIVWSFIILLITVFAILELTQKTHVSQKLSKYLDVKRVESSEEGNVVTMPMSGKRPPVLIPKSLIDNNLPENLEESEENSDLQAPNLNQDNN